MDAYYKTKTLVKLELFEKPSQPVTHNLKISRDGAKECRIKAAGTVQAGKSHSLTKSHCNNHL